MLKAFKALSGTKKVLWGLGILLAPLFIVTAVSPTPDMQKAAQVNQTADMVVVSSGIPETPPSHEPQVMKAETKQVSETVTTPYQSATHEDAAPGSGKATVAIPDIEGQKLGAKARQSASTPRDAGSHTCDRNYTDTCVPVARDVDCKGDHGNGPVFVAGPLRIIGIDIYQLDRDGNGIGCEQS